MLDDEERQVLSQLQGLMEMEDEITLCMQHCSIRMEKLTQILGMENVWLDPEDI